MRDGRSEFILPRVVGVDGIAEMQEKVGMLAVYDVEELEWPVTLVRICGAVLNRPGSDNGLPESRSTMR
jgi:hypothetical protein